MDPEEIEEIKHAFHKADKAGGGTITREALSKIMRQLDSEEWTDEDLHDLFNLVENDGTDIIHYDQFVNYVMHDDCTDHPDHSHDDVHHANAMASQESLAKVPVDLTQKLSRKVYVMLAARLGTDAQEAGHQYDEELVECREEGQNVDDGIPLGEFLDELHIQKRDRQAMQHLHDNLEDIKQKQLDGIDDEEQANSPALEAGIDNILRVLDVQNRPMEDAPRVLNEAHLSNVAFKLLSALSPEELVSKVKDCSINPVVLPSTAGQRGNVEMCCAKVQAIIDRCKADGSKFTDPEWDMTKNDRHVLYVDAHAPGYDCTVGKPHGYKRLSEMFGKSKHNRGGGMDMLSMLRAANTKVVLYKGDHVDESDVVQGQIGTCFFLGALGSIIANDPKVVKRWFIKYDVDVGVYGVRFNHDGEWIHVIVDDWVPVNQYGDPLYARSKDPHEIWCSLIEKAFCKLHTCYEMCDGGRPAEAIFSLLGGISGQFLIDKKYKGDPKAYFHVLQQAFHRGYLLTTGFNPPAGGVSGQGKCGEAVCDSGLVGGHVYSIIKLVEAGGECLIQCRNPWGTGEWKGKWSDANQFGEWTEEMIQATGKVSGNDGTFWMDIQDFVKDSTGVCFARTFSPMWKKLTHYQRFQDTGEMEATALWSYKAGSKDEISLTKGDVVDVISVHKGWWYGHHPGQNQKGFFPGNYVKMKDRPVTKFALTGVPEDGKSAVQTVIIIVQENVLMKRKYYKRKQDGLNYKDTSYPDVQLTCVGPDGRVVWQRSGKRRELYGELNVPAGETYTIYALANDGHGGAFAIRSYMQDGVVTLKELPHGHVSEVTEAMNKR